MATNDNVHYLNDVEADNVIMLPVPVLVRAPTPLMLTLTMMIDAFLNAFYFQMPGFRSFWPFIYFNIVHGNINEYQLKTNKQTEMAKNG